MKKEDGAATGDPSTFSGTLLAQSNVNLLPAVVEVEEASLGALLLPPRLNVGNVDVAEVAPGALAAGVVDGFAPKRAEPPNRLLPAGAAGVAPVVPVVPVEPAAPAAAAAVVP